jgi:Transposase IS116/IS110/IS902 family
VKLVARLHKTLIWERSRQVAWLSAQLAGFFPAALAAYEPFGLDSPDVLELLARAPGPAAAVKLTTAQVDAALKRARRHDRAAKTAAIRAALDGQVRDLFGMHPDAEIITSQPGLGTVLGARVLTEFGDDPNCYASASARKNYAATSPITRRSGKSRYVMARYVHNDRLRDTLRMQAFVALGQSPGARAYYDALRRRGMSHKAALRQLASPLVGILHGCLKTRTRYNEATAWPQYKNAAA